MGVTTAIIVATVSNAGSQKERDSLEKNKIKQEELAEIERHR